MVSNHSGGLIAMDVPVLAVAFHEEFGTARALYMLAHDMLFTGSAGPVMRKAAVREGHPRERRRHAQPRRRDHRLPRRRLRRLRPTSRANDIDFNGRTGYVRTALEAGVPIVPVVSIGGQENQIHLTRGERLGRLGLEELPHEVPAGDLRLPVRPRPAFPPNVPLPTKIVTQVLEPIDIVEEYGPDPDVAEMDPWCARGCRPRSTS